MITRCVVFELALRMVREEWKLAAIMAEFGRRCPMPTRAGNHEEDGPAAEARGPKDGERR